MTIEEEEIKRKKNKQKERKIKIQNLSDLIVCRVLVR